MEKKGEFFILLANGKMKFILDVFYKRPIYFDFRSQSVNREENIYINQSKYFMQDEEFVFQSFRGYGTKALEYVFARNFKTDSHPVALNVTNAKPTLPNIENV